MGANLPWHEDGIFPPCLGMSGSDGSPLDEGYQGDAHALQRTETEQGHAFQSTSSLFGSGMGISRQDRGKRHAKHDGVVVQASDSAGAGVQSRPPWDEVLNGGREAADNHVGGPLAEQGMEAEMDL